MQWNAALGCILPISLSLKLISLDVYINDCCKDPSTGGCQEFDLHQG
jgi:hypothetical protein